MGLIRSFFRMSALCFLFLAGYSYARHAYSDQRYKVQRDKGQAYLVDLVRRERLSIDELNFQIGSLEYRIAGILEDPQLPAVLEHYPRRN